ncbi:MAG: nucleotide exchange factor GrpE [Crocinitomicaceae bacterium]|nr:nucleotide exchange factor GrpE [Crocinitomicaceae bacterium]
MSEDKDLRNEQDEVTVVTDGKPTGDKDNVGEGEKEPKVKDPKAKKPTTEEPEVKEPTAEERYAELNDKYIRIHAEFDNYRKRTNKEKIDIINSANAGVLKDILPVIDDLERAIANNTNVDDVESVKEGFSLIYNKFSAILKAKGLQEMEANGKAFDSELHEAIANIPAPSKKQKGKVIEAVEKGYYLNDKVIRYAKVVVGQ